MWFLFSVVPMATDTPALAYLLAFAGTVVTSITGAVVAIALNRKEKTQSAENSLEKALRERITLRDEELLEVRAQLRESNEERDKAIAQRDRLYLAIIEQRAEEKAHNGDS